MVTLVLDADDIEFSTNTHEGKIVFAEVRTFEQNSKSGIFRVNVADLSSNAGNAEFHVSIPNNLCSDGIQPFEEKVVTLASGATSPVLEWSVSAETVC